MSTHTPSSVLCKHAQDSAVYMSIQLHIIQITESLSRFVNRHPMYNTWIGKKSILQMVIVQVCISISSLVS